MTRHLDDVTDDQIVDALTEYGVHGMGIEHLGDVAARLQIYASETAALEERMYGLYRNTYRLARPGGNDVYALTWIEAWRHAHQSPDPRDICRSRPRRLLWEAQGLQGVRPLLPAHRQGCTRRRPATTYAKWIPVNRLKTWHIEHAVIISVLLTVWIATGCHERELLGSLAVYLSHGAASVGARMEEQEAARPKPSVACYRSFWRYYVAKEIVWAAYFIWAQTWSALVGCVVFAAYPLWRRFYRSRIKPLAKETT